MTDSETNLGTGGRGKDRKKSPEEIAEKRIQDALKTGTRRLVLSSLGLKELPDSIAQLHQMLVLDVSNNQLSKFPESIVQLAQLQRLDAYNCRLATLPDRLGHLTQLQFLYLENNALATLPDSLGQLARLSILDVSHNVLAALPESIGQLTQLENLDVSHNQLAVLPNAITKLALLHQLNVSSNQLMVLPAWLRSLKQLQKLDAAHNLIESLPETVGDLKRLETLRMSGNKLKWLPETLGNLRRLRNLRASRNQLVALPDSIEHLKELRLLNLQKNDLADLPESLARLPRLRELFLAENPRLLLPPEIVGANLEDVLFLKAKPSLPSTILDYYFKMRGGQRPLNEVRFLFVGRGGAGKTSIVQRLIEDRFIEGEPQTKGIDIRSWELKCDKDTVRAHVWDFAGQVITHATHQFFLSHRSVYVLVLTGREDSEKLDAEYWLRLILAFGTEPSSGGASSTSPAPGPDSEKSGARGARPSEDWQGRTSPVIVALNKWELAPCKVDRNALQEKYPFIVGFVETDCKSGLGIAKLNQLIRETVDGMESVREAFPKAWFAIKESLATMKADYVSYGEFRAQCRQLGESDAGAQDSLARVLHRLGVALNYADDERLREATVLNPHWVTNGIYTLLRDTACEKGIMTLADVERVLPQEKPEMRRYLVELMRRFDLAFPLTEAGDEWLVPQRLPPTQPKLGREWHEPGLTRLRYTYTALPEGLIPRFITRTYPLSEGQERWVNGVVLVMDDARALVRADASERCVTASVSGSADGRRRLAGLVRENLRRIHADIRGLDPLEEMELEGQPGEWVRVQTLEADERKKQPSAAATRGGTVSVNNTSELNRVSAPAARDPSQRKAKVFISYSNKDARQHDELTVRLTPLWSEGLVETWSDRCLVAGEEWDKSIRRELEEADVIVLLWSAQFEASEYIQSAEVQRAVERAKAGEAVVVSIILEKCGWERTSVAKYQVLPRKGFPVRNRKPIRDAWYEVQEGLRTVLEELRAKAKS